MTKILKLTVLTYRGGLLPMLHKKTWGAFNSIVGNSIAHGLNYVGKVDNVTHMDGMLAISGITGFSDMAFTIGHLSFGPNNYTADWRDHLFVHEYGHYMQSWVMGPSYVNIVGIPSLLSAAGLSTIPHSYRWFETSASRLGAKYMDKKHGSGKSDYNSNSIDYFNINGFSIGDGAKYINPRTGKVNTRAYPISGARPYFLDYLIF